MVVTIERYLSNRVLPLLPLICAVVSSLATVRIDCYDSSSILLTRYWNHNSCTRFFRAAVNRIVRSFTSSDVSPNLNIYSIVLSNLGCCFPLFWSFLLDVLGGRFG